MKMRSEGWRDMSPQERYEEADNRMRHLTDRRAQLRRRHAPQDWIAHYDEELARAIRDRRYAQQEAMDAADAERRQAYEAADYGA